MYRPLHSVPQCSRLHFIHASFCSEHATTTTTTSTRSAGSRRAPSPPEPARSRAMQKELEDGSFESRLGVPLLVGHLGSEAEAIDKWVLSCGRRDRTIGTSESGGRSSEARTDAPRGVQGGSHPRGRIARGRSHPHGQIARGADAG
jgi:hypothetical protein